MRKNITLTSILFGLLFVFTANAQLTEPSITGPGITRGVYATAGENMTYSITYGSYSATPAQKHQVRWEINPADGDIISQNGNTPSVTIKWRNAGSMPNIRAYNIVTGTKVFDKTQSVYVATKEVGNVVLSGPNATTLNNSITINVSISPAPVGDVYVNFSGTNFTKTSSSGESVTGYFTSTGNQTITATLTGPHIDTKTVTKTITVVPNTINGIDAIAYDKTATYSIPSLPGGITCTWSVSNNLQIISGQGTANVVVKAIGLGDAHIKASILGINILKYITAGVPDENKIQVTIGINNTLYAHFTSRNECRARYTGNGTILEYRWEASGWEVFNPLAADYSIIFLKNILEPSSPMSPTTIKIQARNSVGWSRSILVGAQVNTSSSKNYEIQSTSNGILTVIENKDIDYSLVKNNVSSSSSSLIYELYNPYTGILIKKGTLNKDGGTIDFSNLPNGLYIFTLIINSTDRLTEKIVIRH